MLPCPFTTFSRSRSLYLIIEHLRIFHVFPLSSLHYHILSGVFLAFDMYRYKYSAPSPYIVNTIRDNEHFLWIGAGIWAVSFFFEIHHCSIKLSNPLPLPKVL